MKQRKVVHQINLLIVNLIK